MLVWKREMFGDCSDANESRRQRHHRHNPQDEKLEPHVRDAQHHNEKCKETIGRDAFDARQSQRALA